VPLDRALAGRTFGPTEPYGVSREKIAEFTSAIGDLAVGDDEKAPLTFPIVVAFRALELFFADPSVGIDLRRVVHGAQRFEQVRPLQAGDVVTAELAVESVRSAAGADVITTRTDIATSSGEVLCTASATLVHRAA
jgi:N-terminal half of MaoC dehydratase